MGLARRGGVRSLAGRPATSLARATRRPEALEEIYGWFTEGFETADLRNASHLLEELQS
jgi:hypothetical protein